VVKVVLPAVELLDVNFQVVKRDLSAARAEILSEE
jgi:hypothetical protein